MNRQQAAEKSEKSLSEMLVIVVVVALFMSTFIFYFFKYQGHLSRTGFNSLANVFSARITGIHAQWYMEDQPSFVVINSTESSSEHKIKLRVPLNKAGWVDVDQTELPCQRIWQFVLEVPMVYMKEPITAIVIETQGDTKTRRCQYLLPSGEFFTYQSDNGKVSQVQSKN
jgi:hypothetical protein